MNRDGACSEQDGTDACHSTNCWELEFIPGKRKGEAGAGLEGSAADNFRHGPRSRREK